jgi:hypothetical protein
MSTFLTPTLHLDNAPIPIRTRAFYRARLRRVLHELVFREFRRREQAGQLNKAILARRLGKRPEQVTRWLGTPGNWTLDTVSDLLLGMGTDIAVAIRKADT